MAVDSPFATYHTTFSFYKWRNYDILMLLKPSELEFYILMWVHLEKPMITWWKRQVIEYVYSLPPLT